VGRVICLADLAPLVKAIESMGGGLRDDVCDGGANSSGCNNQSVLVLPYETKPGGSQNFAPVCVYCDHAHNFPRIRKVVLG
jgi:hypothetical protein